MYLWLERAKRSTGNYFRRPNVVWTDWLHLFIVARGIKSWRCWEFKLKMNEKRTSEEWTNGIFASFTANKNRNTLRMKSAWDERDLITLREFLYDFKWAKNWLERNFNRFQAHFSSEKTEPIALNVLLLHHLCEFLVCCVSISLISLMMSLREGHVEHKIN